MRKLMPASVWSRVINKCVLTYSPGNPRSLVDRIDHLSTRSSDKNDLILVLLYCSKAVSPTVGGFIIDAQFFD